MPVLIAQRGRNIVRTDSAWRSIVRNELKVRRRCYSFQRNNKTNGKTLRQSELRKSESWLKIHQGKTEYITNHADSEDILTDQQKNEKVTEFKYLEQTTHLKDTTKEEIYARIRAAWSCFGKKGNTP